MSTLPALNAKSSDDHTHGNGSGAASLFFGDSDFLPDIVRRDRRVSVDLAFAGSGHAAEDRRDNGVFFSQHRERRICEQGIACANGIHEPVDEAIYDEETVQSFMADPTTCQNAAVAQVKDEKLALRCIV